MHHGDFAQRKKKCSEIECISLHGNIICMTPLLFTELVNMAANAAFVKEVETARMLLVGEQLARCREKNNPYNNWLNQPSRQAMMQPDPCLYLAKKHHYLQQKLAGATTEDIVAVQEGARSNAPTAQDLAAAPAPQLHTAYDPVGNTDPAIPESEMIVHSPGSQNTWSPTSLEEAMEMIAAELDQMEVAQTALQIQIQNILVDLEGNARLARLWWCWGTRKHKKTGIRFQPPNATWIGRWTP